MRLDQKTILITGASRGIGGEMARLLGPRANTLVLVARSRDGLESLSRELACETRVVPCDLSRPSAVDDLLREIADLEIDVLVNNAGVGLGGRFASRDEARLVSMLELNILSLTRLTQRLLPGMIERGHGAILNVGSTAGFQGGPFMSSYAASKAYVNIFSDGLASELRGTGVTVCALCPGATRTDFFRAAGIAAEEMLKVSMDARTVAAAGIRALERGEVLHIPGLINKLLVGLQRLAPRWLVRRVALRILRELDR